MSNEGGAGVCHFVIKYRLGRASLGVSTGRLATAVDPTATSNDAESHAAGDRSPGKIHARLDHPSPRNSFSVFRPHRSTTYVDAAYCYRPISVVCMYVCRSPVVNPAKTAEPIEMAFESWTRVGPRKHALDGARIPPCVWAFLGKEHARAYPKTLCRELCRNR